MVLQDARVLASDSHDLAARMTERLVASGQFEKARKACESRSTPLDEGDRHYCLAFVYHALSRQVDAERELGLLKATDGDAAAYFYAEIYAQWGDKSSALHWLAQAEQLHDATLVELRVAPFLPHGGVLTRAEVVPPRTLLKNPLQGSLGGMIGDGELQVLAGRAGQALLARGLHLATAESCTGGFIAKSLTDIPGSSQWFECGYVTYSNRAKIRDLGVASLTLAQHGAVSEAVALEMAAGALRVASVDVAIAVTGIAGPDGALPQKPVGTVWFGSAIRTAAGVGVAAERAHFAGDRDRVRRLSVAHALQMILVLAR